MKKLLAIVILLSCVSVGMTMRLPAAAQGAGSPAPPTGASAVVRQFYTWLISNQNSEGLASVRGLFDDRFYWLLTQEDADHPGSNPSKGYECFRVGTPEFGLLNGLAKLTSFTLGAPITRGDAVAVPVTLLFGQINGNHHNAITATNKVTIIVKDYGGVYKIYDIHDFDSVRQVLEGFARDPNCAWPQSGSGWEKIVFSGERTDIQAVIKTYPILKGSISEVQRFDKAGSSGTPDTLRVRIAVTRSRPRNVGLLFLYIDDQNWCGSHGCKMAIYADEGNGYKQAGDIVVFPLVYLSTGGSQVSLLFCGSLQGGSRWDLKNGALVYVGPSACPAIPH